VAAFEPPEPAVVPAVFGAVDGVSFGAVTPVNDEPMMSWTPAAVGSAIQPGARHGGLHQLGGLLVPRRVQHPDFA